MRIPRRGLRRGAAGHGCMVPVPHRRRGQPSRVFKPGNPFEFPAYVLVTRVDLKCDRPLRGGTFAVMEGAMPSDDPTKAEPVASNAAASVHDLLQKEIAALIESADLSEEEKQQILVGMQCPCCGAGGLSLSIKLKGRPRSTPSF